MESIPWKGYRMVINGLGQIVCLAVDEAEARNQMYIEHAFARRDEGVDPAKGLTQSEWEEEYLVEGPELIGDVGNFERALGIDMERWNEQLASAGHLRPEIPGSASKH